MRRKGIILAAITALLNATETIVSKYGIQNSKFSPFEYAVCAASLAGILSLPLVAKNYKKLLGLSTKTWLQLLCIGIVASGIAYYLLLEGLNSSTAINSSFIVSTVAFFTLFFAAILIKEKISSFKYRFIVSLFIGLYILTTNFGSVYLNIGNLLILLAAILWGFTNAFSKLPMKYLTGELIAYIRLIIGGIFMLVTMLFISYSSFLQLDSLTIWVILTGVLILIQTITFYKAIQYVGPSISILILVSYPVVAAVFAMIFLGETMSIMQIIGGATILASIYYLVKE